MVFSSSYRFVSLSKPQAKDEIENRKWLQIQTWHKRLVDNRHELLFEKHVINFNLYYLLFFKSEILLILIH